MLRLRKTAGVASYVEDFSIEQHPKMIRRQDARLDMLFFYRPLAGAYLFHNVAKRFARLILNFKFIHTHFPLPHLFRDMRLQFKNMITFYIQGKTGQGACKTGITTFKGLSHDPYGGRLVDAKDNEKILCPMLLIQVFHLFLYRKTYGAGGRSDETGGLLINDFGPSSLETVAYCCPGNVIPFSKNDGFFPL
jgi:hypothetical protein